MRVSALLLASFMTTGLVVHADDAAKAIVEKSVKAAGWDKRKSDNQTWKDKGKFTMPGAPESFPYEGEFHVSYPDKYRFSLTVKAGGQEIAMTATLNGDKGWEKANGQVRELKDEKLAYLKDEVYAMYVCSLKPLLDDKGGFELKAIDDAKVDGKKCVGISIAKKDRPTIKLYFNAETNLLAKLEYPVKNEFDNWKEATDEMFIGEWADEDGHKVFKKMKVTRNGKTMIEAEMSDYKSPDKVDPAVYEKP